MIVRLRMIIFDVCYMLYLGKMIFGCPIIEPYLNPLKNDNSDLFDKLVNNYYTNITLHLT